MTEETPENFAEAAGFRVCINKKLIVGQMPEWYFIRDDSSEGSPDEEKPADRRDDCIRCADTDYVTGEGIDCFTIC